MPYKIQTSMEPRAISYLEERPKYTGINLDGIEEDEFQKIFKTFFLTKQRKWAYENEWRLIAQLSKASKVIDNRFHLFEFPEESIVTVIYGCNSSKEFKDRTTTILRNLDSQVQLKEAQLSQTSYVIDIVPYSQ